MTFFEKFKDTFKVQPERDVVAFPPFKARKFYSNADNDLQLVFPEDDLTPREKIFYSLLVEGTQSISGLNIRTGLYSDELDQTLEELVSEGKIKKLGREFFSSVEGVVRSQIVSREPLSSS